MFKVRPKCIKLHYPKYKLELSFKILRDVAIMYFAIIIYIFFFDILAAEDQLQSSGTEARTL